MTCACLNKLTLTSIVISFVHASQIVWMLGFKLVWKNILGTKMITYLHPLISKESLQYMTFYPSFKG